MAARVLLSLAGLALVVAAFPAAGYLSNGEWSTGAVGSWMLVALPGIALMARAGTGSWPRHLLPLVPLAVMLLGLDVTDSARSGVVTGGYCVAGVSAVVALASPVVLWNTRRRQRTAARVPTPA